MNIISYFLIHCTDIFIQYTFIPLVINVMTIVATFEFQNGRPVLSIFGLCLSDFNKLLPLFDIHKLWQYKYNKIAASVFKYKVFTETYIKMIENEIDSENIAVIKILECLVKHLKCEFRLDESYFIFYNLLTSEIVDRYIILYL